MVIIMEEYLKIIEELKNIKNDLRDLPARRLKLIDLLIQKYERLNLEEEALNPLGKYKLIEDVDNPDYEKYAGRYGKSVKEWKAYKETIIEKIETHLPELCDDIDEVIAMKEKEWKEPVQQELDLQGGK